MKKYIIEIQMSNSTDGYCCVVVEGERHLNRTIIKSSIHFFTTQGGYNFNHPEQDAMQNAQAIADGLNALEKAKEQQNTRYPKMAITEGMEDADYRCENGAYHVYSCCKTCWNGHPLNKNGEMFSQSDKYKDVIKNIFIQSAKRKGFTEQQATFMYAMA